MSDAEKLERWHRHELRRLGFNKSQEVFLRLQIEGGEVSLAEVRDKVEVRGWCPEQVMACYSL